jgi:hypothetical protein
MIVGELHTEPSGGSDWLDLHDSEGNVIAKYVDEADANAIVEAYNRTVKD